MFTVQSYSQDSKNPYGITEAELNKVNDPERILSYIGAWINETSCIKCDLSAEKLSIDHTGCGSPSTAFFYKEEINIVYRILCAEQKREDAPISIPGKDRVREAKSSSTSNTEKIEVKAFELIVTYDSRYKCFDGASRQDDKFKRVVSIKAHSFEEAKSKVKPVTFGICGESYGKQVEFKPVEILERK